MARCERRSLPPRPRCSAGMGPPSAGLLNPPHESNRTQVLTRCETGPKEAPVQIRGLWQRELPAIN